MKQYIKTSFLVLVVSVFSLTFFANSAKAFCVQDSNEPPGPPSIKADSFQLTPPPSGLNASQTSLGATFQYERGGYCVGGGGSGVGSTFVNVTFTLNGQTIIPSSNSNTCPPAEPAAYCTYTASFDVSSIITNSPPSNRLDVAVTGPGGFDNAYKFFNITNRCTNLCSSQNPVTPPTNATCTNNVSCSNSALDAANGGTCNSNSACTAWVCSAGYVLTVHPLGASTCELPPPANDGTINISSKYNDGSACQASWTLTGGNSPNGPQSGSNYAYSNMTVSQSYMLTVSSPSGASISPAASQLLPAAPNNAITFNIDCGQVPTKFSCTNNACVADPNGQYTTLGSCSAVCPAPTRFSCTGAGASCAADPFGPFATPTCNNNCGPGQDFHLACVNSACTYVAGRVPNADGCSVAGASCAPGGAGTLTCSPASQTVTTGAAANFSASSSAPGTYSWSGGGNPAAGSGANFSTTFSSPGVKSVLVTSGSNSASCTATVNCPAGTIQSGNSCVPVGGNTCQLTFDSSQNTVQDPPGTATYIISALSGTPANAQLSAANFSDSWATFGSLSRGTISAGQSATLTVNVDSSAPTPGAATFDVFCNADKWTEIVSVGAGLGSHLSCSWGYCTSLPGAGTDDCSACAGHNVCNSVGGAGVCAHVAGPGQDQCGSLGGACAPADFKLNIAPFSQTTTRGVSARYDISVSSLDPNKPYTDLIDLSAFFGANLKKFTATFPWGNMLFGADAGFAPVSIKPTASGQFAPADGAYGFTINGASSIPHSVDGQIVIGNSHASCVNNACTQIPGSGVNSCSTDADCEAPPPPPGSCPPGQIKPFGSCGGNTCIFNSLGCGVSTCSSDLDCAAPQNGCRLDAIPPIVPKGASSMLSWTCASGVTGCSLSGFGSVNPSGTQSVSPAQTTSYTLSCMNGAVPVAASATVRISTLIECNPSDPTCKPR